MGNLPRPWLVNIHLISSDSRRIWLILLQSTTMKKWIPVIAILVFALLFGSLSAAAQCSICTKTAQQLGEGPAKGLNTGILYLAFMPLAIIGFIGYRWWKSNHTA
jgi:hypothetical protein